jgi:two-component system sensor histidine kinase PilS (NtrC family)
MVQHKNSHQPGLQDISYTAEGQRRKILNLDRASYFDEHIDERMNLYLVKDVTDLRALENQLLQTEKLAAVGQLAAGIAHEIRNPLAGISGSIQMLSQEHATDPQQKKLMDIVIREIDRLNLLITDFLNYAKPEKSPEQPVDLRPVIEEVLALSRRHPDVSPGFVWDTDIQSVQVLGFAEKLKQAFYNICINSLQAMKDRPVQKLEVRLSARGDWAVLSIKDSGAGMSEDTKKKMFEPFHTTKAKGTGLGLAITYKILEVHRAQIDVQSELGVGTEFIIKFPLVTGVQEELR